MGKGRDAKDVAPMACCGLGFVLFVAGCVLLATAKDQEIDMWYSVVLCPVTNGTVSNNKYISYDTVSACPGNLRETDSMQQTFEVLKNKFTDGLKYGPAVLRSDGTTVEIDFVVTDGSQVVFDSTDVVMEPVPARRLLSMDEAEADVDAVERSDSSVEEVSPHSRRLLKSGGGSSGSSSSGGGGAYGGRPMRSRSGSGSRYGSTTRRSTPYGYSGRSAVRSGTVVYVYHRGPRGDSRGGRYSRNGRYHSEESRSCDDGSQGCAYETGNDLTRDEFAEEQKFEAAKPASTTDAYLLTVRKCDVIATTSDMPAVFITFFTTEKTFKEKVGTGLMMAGPVIMCCLTPCLFVAMQRMGSRGSSSSATRAGGFAAAGGGAAGGAAIAANKWSSSSFSDGDEVSLTELPPFMGMEVRADLHDGDRVSTDVDDLPGGNYDSVNHLILRSNDIRRVEGLHRFPNLIRLDLKNNDLLNLDTLADHPPTLRSVDVSDNELSSVEGVDASGIVELNIANNNLRYSLNLRSPNIMWLNVSLNDLTAFGEGFCPNLRYLDARGNDIIDIRGLYNCRMLETVVLADNDLGQEHAIKELATCCPNLIYLDLTNNEFDYAAMDRIRSAFNPYTRILP